MITSHPRWFFVAKRFPPRKWWTSEPVCVCDLKFTKEAVAMARAAGDHLARACSPIYASMMEVSREFTASQSRD